MKKLIIKILLIILLLGICVTAVAFAVKGNSGAKYTEKDLQESYDKGYADAGATIDGLLVDNANLEKTVETLTAANLELTNKHDILLNENATLAADILRLTSERDTLVSEKELLNQAIANMESEKQGLIDEHRQNISRLNSQITALNVEIENLNTQMQNNLMIISSLNDTIASLQKDIRTYQEYLSQFETPDRAIVTFEFAGEVYEFKTVTKGEKVSIDDPKSTELIIFNGWTLDGEPINLDEYIVEKNVRIVADCTYKYVVSFAVDNVVKATQIIEKGNCVIEPPTVRKSGYTFKCWTLDGETEVHFDQVPILSNTTFLAKFAPLYDVSFVYEDITLITRRIEENATTTPYKVADTEKKVLNGWKVNNVLVDVNNYKITCDTVFVADIIYKAKVDFMSQYDSNPVELVETQYVEIGKNAKSPVIAKESFIGWTLGENKDELIDINNYAINIDTVFFAKYDHWKKVNDESIVVYNNGKGSAITKINVNDLQRTDTFKVTFSLLAIEDTDDIACEVWYWTSDGRFDRQIGINSDKIKPASLEIENGVIANLTSRSSSSWIGTIKAECLVDGVLTITVTSNNEYIFWHNLIIDSIVVYVN